jgi:hypothetical protein
MTNEAIAPAVILAFSFVVQPPIEHLSLVDRNDDAL